METVLGIIVGIGLAASCGFRVFVPMFVMSVAVKAGQLSVAENWHWIGSWPALSAFGVATVIEIIAFYIPWIDHLLDTIATPSSVVAGIIATAACVSEMSPLLQWSTAIIAGGGIAAAVQSSTVLVRGTSTVTTGGLGNFVVSTIEWMLSLFLSVLAIVVPIVAGLLLVLMAGGVLWILLRRRARRLEAARG
ncbi:MAG: DUF4126 domain-containing protein [Planctomycetes bacterium]|nr:DUF4126 domain-containing protein [Planctomycetota bacterium]